MEINIVELATKLAEVDLLKQYGDKELGEMIHKDVIEYTKKEQDIFNRYYDYYMTVILSCKQLN